MRHSSVLIVAWALLFTCIRSVADAAPDVSANLSLASWRSVGPAQWRLDGEEIVGALGVEGRGWLLTKQDYQDFDLQFAFECDKCHVETLMGLLRQPQGTSGLAVAFERGSIDTNTVLIDANGRELHREPPPPAGQAPEVASNNGLPPRIDWPIPQTHALAGETVDPKLAGGWNWVEVRRVGDVLQVFLNGLQAQLQGKIPTATSGPLAIGLYGGAASKVRIRNIRLTDFTDDTPSQVVIGEGFKVQEILSQFYGQGEAVGDMDRDGHPDFVSGPYIFFGPKFVERHAFDLGKPLDPTGYVVGQPLGVIVADFTGDGWPDILTTAWPAGSPGVLHVNPSGKNRRWDKYEVLPAVEGELFALTDLYAQGKDLDFVFAANGTINVARPDPAKPTESWVIHALTTKGPWGQRNAHGLGVGDVNGDGRADIISAWGWWEQPADRTDAPWPFHPEVFGRSQRLHNPGGGQIRVYDVNGDGLPDVISSLEGHGYGLAWFEQTRDTSGHIHFIQHMIMDLDPKDSAGVVFSELHTLALADIDGDGALDIVTGKTATNIAHFNQYGYPDSDSDGVVYWFQLVRDKKASGGARFIPHLVYNHSGIGRQVQVLDLNGDGRPDIATTTRSGMYIFWNGLSRHEQ